LQTIVLAELCLALLMLMELKRLILKANELVKARQFCIRMNRTFSTELLVTQYTSIFLINK